MNEKKKSKLQVTYYTRKKDEFIAKYRGGVSEIIATMNSI